MDAIRSTREVVEAGYPDLEEHLAVQRLSMDSALIFLAVQEL